LINHNYTPVFNEKEACIEINLYASNLTRKKYFHP
jgi:hypothetical protein